MKSIFILLFILPLMGSSHAPKASTGVVKRFFLESKFIDNRNVDVWLPDNYDPSKKYATLYMHDGQMLYDKGTTWNSSEWQVDETLDSLLKANVVEDVIVIGIANNGNKRFAEYFPEKAIPDISEPRKSELLSYMPEGPTADNYLKFIVTELKPFIDKTFSTYPDRGHTFICGSSMGGLISLYALCEYPEIFAGAACISTHWIGVLEYNTTIPEAINKYLDIHLPSPANHKIYFDCGTEGLDANYPACQTQVDILMKQKGYTSSCWQTLVFEGAGHSEKFWAKRLYLPFTFLLSN